MLYRRNRLLPRLRLPCLRPLSVRTSRHSSASTRLHYEVSRPQRGEASSLTNQPADRLSAHLSRHHRRLDNTKPQRATYTCTAGLRPCIHICSTALLFEPFDPTRAVRWIQRTSSLPFMGLAVRRSGLLRWCRHLARPQRSRQCAAADPRLKSPRAGGG